MKKLMNESIRKWAEKNDWWWGKRASKIMDSIISSLIQILCCWNILRPLTTGAAGAKIKWSLETLPHALSPTHILQGVFVKMTGYCKNFNMVVGPLSQCDCLLVEPECIMRPLFRVQRYRCGYVEMQKEHTCSSCSYDRRSVRYAPTPNQRRM